MLSLSTLLLVSAALGRAVAKPILHSGHLSARDNATGATKQKILIGGGSAGNVLLADFDGSAFNFVGNVSLGEGINPSWVAFKQPNIIYAVNENSNNMFVLNVDLQTNALTKVSEVSSSVGVVHLEFNKNQTRMVGASYTKGAVDYWELAADGTPTLKTTLATNPNNEPLGPNTARQEAPHAHQSVLDNSGRFFFVNDLGLDDIIIFDSQGDDFKIANRTKVQPGCGPRHGVFYPPAAAEATHYIVLCEMLDILIVHQLNYTVDPVTNPNGFPQMIATQVISTFGEQFPPAASSTPSAGEIAASRDGKSIYASNRLSFDPNVADTTDSISHFSADVDAAGKLTLTFVDQVSSQGRSPRMFGFGVDDSQAVVFGTNQNAGSGLAAFSRCAGSGTLTPIDTSKVAYAKFSGPEKASQTLFGPTLVIGIPGTA